MIVVPFFLMKRSKSLSSLLIMSQIEFNPFDSDTFPSDEESQFPDGAQSLPIGAHGIPSAQFIEEETESEEPPPDVHADNQFPTDITFTNTNEIRTVLATLSGFKCGRLGSYLTDQKGLLLLPLHAVTSIRTIAGNHNMQYPCIVFYPKSYPEEAFRQVFPNLMDAIDNLYSSNKP